jgi:hypothetical protein
VRCTNFPWRPGDPSLAAERQGKNSTTIKIGDVQNHEKEQFDVVTASATNLQNGLHAIASAYGDYAKI